MIISSKTDYLLSTILRASLSSITVLRSYCSSIHRRLIIWIRPKFKRFTNSHRSLISINYFWRIATMRVSEMFQCYCQAKRAEWIHLQKLTRYRPVLDLWKRPKEIPNKISCNHLAKGMADNKIHHRPFLQIRHSKSHNKYTNRPNAKTYYKINLHYHNKPTKWELWTNNGNWILPIKRTKGYLSSHKMLLSPQSKYNKQQGAQLTIIPSKVLQTRMHNSLEF